MRARSTTAARSKAAQQKSGLEARGLERRRGLISFMTWAFVLAELFGRDSVAAAPAHGADADEPASKTGGDDAAARAPDPADRVLTGLGAQASDQMPNGTAESTQSQVHTTGDYGHVAMSPVGGDDAIGGKSAQFSGDEFGSQVATRSEPQTVSVDTGHSPAHDAMVPGADLSPETPVLSIWLSPDGILHDVVDTLSAVPLVGGVVSNTLHTAEALAGTVIEGVEDTVQSVGNLIDNVLGSAGHIKLGADPSDGGHHELQTAQGFTPYGIALELNLSGNGALPGDLGALSAQVDHVLDALGLMHDADPTHSEYAGQRSSADTMT